MYILHIFLYTFNERVVAEGFLYVSYCHHLILVVNPMRFLLRLVQIWKIVAIISRFCATPSCGWGVLIRVSFCETRMFFFDGKYSQSHLGWHFRKLFQSSKLEGLFSLKRGKRDVGALSFELSKMSPQVGLAVYSFQNASFSSIFIYGWYVCIWTLNLCAILWVLCCIHSFKNAIYSVVFIHN